MSIIPASYHVQDAEHGPRSRVHPTVHSVTSKHDAHKLKHAQAASKAPPYRTSPLQAKQLETCPIPPVKPQKHAAPPPTQLHLKLTAAALAEHEETYSEAEGTFEQEVRSRAKQEAGEHLGFNLKLDCYEQEHGQLKPWVVSQNTFFKDRIIFKDLNDIVGIVNVAESIELALDIDTVMDLFM